MFNKKGFSLVELMIVVAIIGILAAIAIPNFLTMQAKSKRAEVPGNVDGIKTSQVTYNASYDQYLDLTASPSGTPSKNPVAWSASGTAWSSLGWEPDGTVRGNYAATAANSATPPDFTVTGLSNVDGDSTTATYRATRLTNATITAGNEGYY